MNITWSLVKTIKYLFSPFFTQKKFYSIYLYFAPFLNHIFLYNLKTKTYWVRPISAVQAKVIWIELKINLWETNSISHDTFHPQGCDQNLHTSLTADLRSVEMLILWNVKERSLNILWEGQREKKPPKTKTNLILTIPGTSHPGPKPT